MQTNTLLTEIKGLLNRLNRINIDTDDLLILTEIDNLISDYEAVNPPIKDVWGFVEQSPEPKTYTRDEIITITNNMHRYGGGFMKALSECIHRADHENMMKLQSVFADDFERYLKF